MLYTKITIPALAAAVAFTIFPQGSSAFAEDQDGFTYTIINEEATIIGFTGEPVYIEIPETIEDCPVTQIRDNAFFNCSTLRQISLPPTITKIGHHTFYACCSLESIVLPASLEDIGMGAFSGCTSLSAVNIPDTLTVLPEACFQSCSSLTETVIPTGITIIDDLCFSGCTSLSYVSIGNSVEEIGAQAFYMCSSLKSLYIPPSVKQIERESAGFELNQTGTAIVEGFTVLGEPESAAEKYAEMNKIKFSAASEAIQAAAVPSAPIKRVPLWIILLLAFGGIGFFALSCIIAVKQHWYEKKKKDYELCKIENITIDKEKKI